MFWRDSSLGSHQSLNYADNPFPELTSSLDFRVTFFASSPFPTPNSTNLIHLAIWLSVLKES